MSKRRVLIVDDNPDIRLLLRRVLEPDYDLSEVTNGEEAIAFLEREIIDVVILDVEMPVTNGWETLQVIRDVDNGFPEVKVIMLTVLKDPQNALKAWAGGVSYYVTKPFSPSQVLEVVGRAIHEPLPQLED